jgi:hypothetical protein
MLIQSHQFLSLVGCFQSKILGNHVDIAHDIVYLTDLLLPLFNSFFLVVSFTHHAHLILTYHLHLLLVAIGLVLACH